MPPERVGELLSIENKPAETFLRRWEEYGDECRGIFYRDQLVGYAWISSRIMRVPELDYRRALQENELYLYNTIIKKNWRKRGFYALFLGRLIREVSSQGKIIYVSSDFTNYPAIQAHLRSGFRHKETITLAKAGKFWSHHFQKQ